MTTATDLYSLVLCAHRVYLDRHGDPAGKIAASSFLEMLWKEGREHEERVVTALDIVDAKMTDDFDARVADTLRLMGEGHAWIYHGYLRRGDLVGEPDLLRRVEEPSVLGSHSYVPVDVKAGGAWEKGKTPQPKEQYLIQLCAYAELLEAAQGVLPLSGMIIDRSGEPQTYDLASYWPTYERRRDELRQIVSRELATEPGWTSASCPYCGWQDHCWRALEAADDLTTVAGVGPGRRESLRGIGIHTASQLAAAEPEVLITARGVGMKQARTWPRQARAQKRGSAELIAPWSPPHADFEISYDIEDYMPEDCVYLHGLLVRKSGARRHESAGFSPGDFGSFDPLCLTAGQSERELWCAFLARLETYDDLGEFVVYVYSSHETAKLRQLEAKHGGSKALDRFVARFVDLRQELERSVVLPTDSHSLKAVARWIGCDWRDEDPGGAQSLAWWAEYLADPARNGALRERVIAYNEDDVRASFVVRDWLERFSREVSETL